MAKILTDLEIIDIVARAPREFEDAEQYERFVADIARVVTDHFGGAVGTVERVAPGFFTDPQHDDGPAPKQHLVATSPSCEPTVSVAIHPDESVPAGGGIWIGYDPDADSEFNTSGQEDPGGGALELTEAGPGIFVAENIYKGPDDFFASDPAAAYEQAEGAAPEETRP